MDAQAARAAGARKPPPKPKPGWVVDRVRFEPLAGRAPAGAAFAVAGVGAYRGAIEVVPAPTGGVAVVNQVPLEDYVRGIAEVPSTWPVEALKAQAIAARTYVLHELGVTAATAAKGVGADTCATDACQVYAGTAKEQDDATGNWAAAVAQTAGQVVLYKGAAINAKYSSSNGGRSVAGAQPYLRAVDDPDDRFSPLHRWRSTVSLADVAAGMGLPGTVLNVSRRENTVAVDWQGGDGGVGRLDIAVTDFRARLNALPTPPSEGLPRLVPSYRFSAATDGGAGVVVLDGAGWGHGIGLSQWGAYGKALQGMRAADILAAYYSGLRPTAVPAEQLPATLRVAVDLGRPTADVLGAGRFRVLDGSGRPLAVAAAGQWRVVPEGKGVRVLPPPGQDAAPTVQPLTVDPAAPQVDRAVHVKFRLTAAALVKVVLADEAGGQTETEARLLDAGEAVQALPAPSRPGRYTLTISADAGGGRTAHAPLALDVRPLATTAREAAAGRLDGGRVRHAVAPRHTANGAATDPRGVGALAAAALLALLAALAALAPRAARPR